MVVDDLYIPCFTVTPPEADAPLLVDADAVESAPVAPQGFKPVAGWHPQIVQPDCGIDGQELGSSPSLYLYRESSDGVARKDRRGPLVGETLDHVLA